jgi:hypothetical protein
MFHDTLYGNYGYTPLRNLVVYLRNPQDSTSFLYTVRTDNLGQFFFSGIDTTMQYQVTASFDSNQVHYNAKLNYTPLIQDFLHSRDTLIVAADTISQNGIHLIVKDTTSAPVRNVTVHVFNSRVLFQADTAAGKIFDMVSNSAGLDNRFNVAPAMYYFRAKTRIGNVDLIREDSVRVDAKGIKTMLLTLRSVPFTANGIELHLSDMFVTPVANATIYFYRSFAVFQNDPSPYSNSLFTLNSNAAGFASVYIIDPATYYVRAVKVVSSTITLSGIGNVTVGNNTISQLSLTLQ